jgi:hypothetical protein
VNLEERLRSIAAGQTEVERAQGYEDLCYEAEVLVDEGRGAEAVPVFQVLAALDPNDDLLEFCVRSAEEQLEKLGLRAPPDLPAIARRLEKQFGKRPPQERYLAVAKTLFREHRRRREAVELALEYLERAQQLGPLGRGVSRFAAELRQVVGRRR